MLSNTNLLGLRIHNYRYLYERRILFAFGVTYDTPYEMLAAIPGIVKQIVDGVAKTRFDRAHFKGFGDSSLDFEVVYYILSPDYNLYMDTQQTINLTLMKLFAKDGIEFAYPTRTIFIEKESEPA